MFVVVLFAQCLMVSGVVVVCCVLVAVCWYVLRAVASCLLFVVAVCCLPLLLCVVVFFFVSLSVSLRVVVVVRCELLWSIAKSSMLSGVVVGCCLWFGVRCYALRTVVRCVFCVDVVVVG